jgi:hypothetical protein
MFSCSVCINTKSFLVTWMMDLGRSSLDGRDLGKKDVCHGRLHGSYTMGTTDT